jgi:acetyltransferase
MNALRPELLSAHRQPVDRPVAIRRVRPADSAALQAFYAHLSPDSRRARFLGTCAGLSERQAMSFCTLDHQHAEGFVAFAGAGTGDQQLVGHLCLEPSGEQRLELAVAVADEWQGRGIGRTLFERALRWAQEHGTVEIIATAYADNVRVLRLLSSAPHAPTISGSDAGVVTVTIPLVASLPTVCSLPTVSQRVPRAAQRTKALTGRARRRCRVSWRRRQPPVRGAGG